MKTYTIGMRRMVRGIVSHVSIELKSTCKSKAAREAEHLLPGWEAIAVYHDQEPAE